MLNTQRLLLAAACTLAVVQCSSANTWQPLQVHATVAQEASDVSANSRLAELAVALPALLESQVETTISPFSYGISSEADGSHPLLSGQSAECMQLNIDDSSPSFSSGTAHAVLSLLPLTARDPNCLRGHAAAVGPCGFSASGHAAHQILLRVGVCPAQLDASQPLGDAARALESDVLTAVGLAGAPGMQPLHPWTRPAAADATRRFAMALPEGGSAAGRTLQALPCADTGLCNCADRPNGITCAEKAAVLAEHNKLRAQVSPSASDMLRMKWDIRLETVAQNYANRCIWGHNSQRTAQYQAEGATSNAGENLAMGTGTAYTVERFTNLWYDEVADYTFSSNACAPGKVCGHYTQLAWAASDLLGCGVRQCPTVSGSSFTNAKLLVCNYSPHGNFNGRHPYTSGASCSACPGDTVCDTAGKLCIPPGSNPGSSGGNSDGGDANNGGSSPSSGGGGSNGAGGSSNQGAGAGGAAPASGDGDGGSSGEGVDDTTTAIVAVVSVLGVVALVAGGIALSHTLAKRKAAAGGAQAKHEGGYVGNDIQNPVHSEHLHAHQYAHDSSQYSYE